MTYDDNRLRWNGADLLTRVARNFLSEENKSIDQKELKVQPSYIFFPISSQNITRYSPNFEFISLHAYSFFSIQISFFFGNHTCTSKLLKMLLFMSSLECIVENIGFWFQLPLPHNFVYTYWKTKRKT
jgi:hypothetical protein